MLPRQETIDRWCCYVLEGGWLLALALVPLYFNPFSARIFEPDKVSALRVIVLVMVTAGAIRLLNRAGGPLPARNGASGVPVSVGSPVGRLIRFPLALPVALYLAVFVLTTLLSVAPRVSLWGSYARADGLYTHLAYVVLFMLLTWTLRTSRQVERIITITLLAGLVVAAYALLQRTGLDPLPWNANVPDRVTSTLGNPIFVGAFLGMVMPFGLMRLAQTLVGIQSVPPTSDARSDLFSAVARVLLVVATLALLLATIKLLAVVRDSPGHMWLLPGVLAASVGLWLVSMEPVTTGPRISLHWLVSAGVVGLAALVIAFLAAGGRSAPLADDRWAWLLVGIGGVVGWLLLSKMSARAGTQPSRLSRGLEAVGIVAILLVIFAAIVFTQSRGPWLGASAGVYVFVSLLLWRSHADAHVVGRFLRAGRIRRLVLAWAGMTVLLAASIILLNTSDTPAFQTLRSMPYVGRLGRLIEMERGTGLERRLFWFGDSSGGGVIGLALAHPWRTLTGWGPETMLLVYEPFYPPSLGPLLRYLATDRYLAPDRAHQALLDILVTRGVLGLVSYVALFATFAVLAVKLMARATPPLGALLAIAGLAGVLGSAVEQLVGIPIAATALLFWVTAAVTARHALLAEQPEPARQATAPVRAPGSKNRPRSRRDGRIERRATPFAVAVYGLLAVGAMAGAWVLDLRPIYADVRFLAGRTQLDRRVDGPPNAEGIAALTDAVRIAPEQDLYVLVLGQGLARVAEDRHTKGVPIGAPPANIDLQVLLAIDSSLSADQFLKAASPLQLLAYAEAAMERARSLNPQSKEPLLGLARLNRTWYEWTREPARLDRAIAWYRAVTDVAPHDVPLLLERARFMSRQANGSGDATSGVSRAAEAAELVERAERLLPGSAEVDRARVEISQRP